LAAIEKVAMAFGSLRYAAEIWLPRELRAGRIRWDRHATEPPGCLGEDANSFWGMSRLPFDGDDVMGVVEISGSRFTLFGVVICDEDLAAALGARKKAR
jgi:hypothetical protein